MVVDLTGRRRLSLLEYGPPAPLEASAAEIRAIEVASLDWKTRLGLSSAPFVVRHDGGHTTIAAQGVTGVVRLRSVDVEVVPKFLGGMSGPTQWRTALWRILALVESAPTVDDLTAAQASADLGLADLVAEVFVHTFRKGAARGLPRTYREATSAEPVLRGSLDVSRLAEWTIRPWLVPCTVDVLVDDTDAARLLRWTASQLARTVVSSRRAQALLGIAAELGHAGPPPSRRRARGIVLGVQHKALQAAVDIGALVLEGQGLEHAGGGAELGGFLWNSDDVYERFVFQVCSTAARNLSLRATKVGVRFGEPVAGGLELATRPDVLVQTAGGRVVAVIDAKYKRFGRRPQAADTYQVLAAAHATGCGWVALTYPVDGDDRSAKVWSVRSSLGGGEVRVTALWMNLLLAASPAGIQHLVHRVENWITAAEPEL